jgi:hypothetical protein
VGGPPSSPKPVLPTPPPTAASTKPQPITRPATRALRPIPSRARLPTHYLAHNAPLPARYSAQAVFRHKYAHHIAALATTPIAGKQASLPKLLRGPEAATWLRSNANEWGRLLEFGIGRDRPIAERITGTGTILKSRCTIRPTRLLRKLRLQYSPSENGNTPCPHDGWRRPT